MEFSHPHPCPCRPAGPSEACDEQGMREGRIYFFSLRLKKIIYTFLA
jgi:hypothetical protein